MRLVSPIFWRELRQSANRRQAWLSRLVVVAVLMAGMCWCYRGPGSGELLLFGVAWLDLFALLLCTPILTAGTVSGECEAKTLELLFLTRLTPRHIVQDKGLARLIELFYLVAVSFPFLLAALCFGGVGTEQAVGVLAVILHTALLAGGVSLLASAWSQNYVSALAISYGVLAALLLGAPLVLPDPWACVLSPCVALQELQSIGRPRWRFGGSTPVSPWVGLGVAGGGYVVALILACERLRTWPARQARAASRRPPAVKAPRRWDFLLWLHPGKLLDYRGRLGNWPLYWRLGGVGANPAKRVVNRLFFGGLVLLGAWLTLRPRYYRDTDEFLVAALPVALLLTLMVAVTVFTQERHADTWELLLTAGLSGRRIVGETFLALARGTAAIWLTPLVLLAYWQRSDTAALAVRMLASTLCESWPLLLYGALALAALGWLAVRLIAGLGFRFFLAMTTVLAVVGLLASVIAVGWGNGGGDWRNEPELWPFVLQVPVLVVLVLATGMTVSASARRNATALGGGLLLMIGALMWLPFFLLMLVVWLKLSRQRLGVLVAGLFFGIVILALVALTAVNIYDTEFLGFWSPLAWLLLFSRGGAVPLGMWSYLYWGFGLHLLLMLAIATTLVWRLGREFDAVVGRQAGGAAGRTKPAPGCAVGR